MKKIPVRQLGASTPEHSLQERITVRSVASILQENDLPHALHRHDFFFLLALENGHGQHEIDFTIYPIQNNTIFFLRPGQIHRLELKADSTGCLVEFNSAFYTPTGQPAAQRFRKASHKNYCIPDPHRFAKLHGILASMLQEYTDRHEGYRDFLRSSLDLFFIEYVRQSPNPKSSSTNVNTYTQNRFEEFQELLSTHIATHKQVAHYIDLMNISAYQLNDITKSSIGKTASQLINEQIILEAKRYLLATPNQVKDIADHLGYEDTSYFIRFFKKQTGHSPEAYRRLFT